MTEVMPEIAALVAQYVGYSEGMNFEGKRSLWDQDDPQPLLMPEEAHEPIIGWAAINAYWSKSRVIMESLKSRSANHLARQIAPDLAIATYDMRWVATLAGPANVVRKPIAADVRVTALLRRKPEGWRFFHLMEGPIDLLGMARLAAEQTARESAL